MWLQDTNDDGLKSLQVVDQVHPWKFNGMSHISKILPKFAQTAIYIFFVQLWGLSYKGFGPLQSTLNPGDAPSSLVHQIGPITLSNTKFLESTLIFIMGTNVGHISFLPVLIFSNFLFQNINVVLFTILLVLLLM